jgi:hypothetical protein
LAGREHGDRRARQLGSRTRRHVARRLIAAAFPARACTQSGNRDGRRSRCGRNARLAKAAVGGQARVDHLDELSDPLDGAGATERANTPAIQVAERVPTTVAILVDRAQLRASDEPRLALEPGAVPSRSARRAQAFQHGALDTQIHDRLVRRKGRGLRLGQADPLAYWKRLAQPRVPVLPRASSDIFAIYGEKVEGHEPKPLRRGSLAREYRSGDRREVLRRLAVTLGSYNQLTVKRGSARDVGKGAEQRAQTRGQVGAMA